MFANASFWDWINLVQLVVTFVGFGLTIAAAVIAARAANGAKTAIIRSQTLSDFGAAIIMMEEIKRLHRIQAWSIVPERYSALRAILISIRTSNPNLPSDQLAALQTAIKNFSDFEGTVERSISANKAMPNPAKFNSIVSAQVDRLNEILSAIQQDIGR
jgi:hypothetical protein